MVSWFWFAIAAAVFYGLHQVTTRLASTRIGKGVGGFLVEASTGGLVFLAQKIKSTTDMPPALMGR